MFAASYFSGKANDKLTVTLSSEIREEYKRNSYLEIPAVISPSGVTARLVYPSGKEFVGKKALLSEEGKYSLRYEKNGDAAIYEFSVVNGMESLFSYGSLVTVDEQPLPAYFEGTDFDVAYENGARITVKKGVDNTVYYNGVIDLGSLGAMTNDPKTAFLDMAFTPVSNTAKEISKFRIVLTDVYDESNYLNIDVVAGDTQYLYKHSVYVKTAAKDMYAPLGYSGGKYVDYGTTFRTSPYGYVEGWRPGSLKLFFNNETLQLSGLPNGDNHAASNIFDAFGNASVVGEENVWSGFTTGEVYLRLEFPEITAAAASFVVFSVGGNNLYTDYSKPEETKIAIITNDFDESSDYAIAGENNYFDVFKAVAYSDNYGIITDVSARVFFDDGVTVKEVRIDDGKFRTDKAGRYVVNYSAFAPSGRADKEITVTVRDNYKAGDELTYEFSDKIPDEVNVDGEVTLFSGTLTGGKGKVTVSYTVNHDGEEVETIKFGKNDGFIAKNTGVYTVTANVRDSFGGFLTKTKEITVAYDAAPRIGEPILLERYIVGNSYVFGIPECVYEGEEGERAAVCELFINGENYTGRQYAVTGDFTLVYKSTVVGDENKKSERSFDIKTVEPKVGADFVSGYFLTEGFTVESTERYITFTADAAHKRVAMLPLTSAKDFSLGFAPNGKLGFGAIEFILSDSADRGDSVSVEYRYVKRSDGVALGVYINGEKGSTYSALVDPDSAETSYFYLADDGSLTNGNNDYLGKITNYSNGKAYDGFSSGAVFLEIRLKDTTDGSFNLVEVGGQILSSLITEDRYGPAISLKNELSMGAFVEVGYELKFAPAAAYDFFGQTKSLKLTVTDPDDNVAYTDNGDKYYTLVLNKKGVWSVTYEAEDVKGNKSYKESYVIVRDVKKPEITLKKINYAATAGKSYKLAAAQVVCGNDYTVTKYVVGPDGRKYRPDERDEVVLRTEGNYTVYYFVYDSENNYALASYNLVVKGDESR